MSTQRLRTVSAPHLGMLPPSVLSCPAYKKVVPSMGLPKSLHALQTSKKLGMRCSNVGRAPQDPVSITTNPQTGKERKEKATQATGRVH
eukprot:36585-Pelagomonas_calceolata.AAC.1